jgi:hypothetical protein
MAIYSSPFSPPTLAPEPTPEPTPQQQLRRVPATHRGLRMSLATFEAFMVLSTLSGAIFVVPNLPLDMIKRGPFTDFTVPALGLGVLCGGAALVAMLTPFALPRLAVLAAIVGGTFMIVFELVEIYVIGFGPVDTPTNPVAYLQVLYIVAGMVGIALGLRLWKLVHRSSHW